MRTLLALLAGAMLALGASGTASAKELAGVAVCGADGCRDVTSSASHDTLDPGPTAEAPAAAAPFYRVKVTVEAGKEDVRFTMAYVPSAGRIRLDDGTWTGPFETTVAELDRLVAGSEPLPAERLPGLPMPAAAPVAPPAGDGLPLLVWVLLGAGLLAAGALAVRLRGAVPAG